MNRLRYLSYSLLLIICLFMCRGFIYAYKEYKIGDEIEYNGIKFYVIKNSNSKEDSLTMLKAEPLTVDEVNKYGGVGTENNHVNRYTEYSQNEVSDIGEDGYGGMTYYSSETCVHYFIPPIYTGCTNDYADSDVKYAVDAWALAKISSNDLVVDYTGYSVRLITIDDLKQLGYVKKHDTMGDYYDKSDDVPSWLYNSDYYWTMSPPTYIYTSRSVISIKYDGTLVQEEPIYAREDLAVRPVITVKKSAIKENEEEIIDDDINKSDTDAEQTDEKVTNNEIKTKVNVPNTFEKMSIIFILMGIVLVSISTIILIRNRNIIKK